MCCMYFSHFAQVLTAICFLQIFRLLMRINIRVLLVLLLFGLGALFYIGASTSPIIVFVYSVCIISFLVSIYLTKWVLSKDEGPPEMVQVLFVSCFALFSILQFSPPNIHTELLLLFLSFNMHCKRKYWLVFCFVWNLDLMK